MKPKVDNAVQETERGILHLIDPGRPRYTKKLINKALREWNKLERPPGTRHDTCKRRAPESNKIPNAKHACIVEAHESARQRLESSRPKDSWRPDLWLYSGFSFDDPSTIWRTRLVLCTKRYKIQMQKQQWMKKGKSSRRSQYGNWRRSRVREEVILEAQRDKPHWWTYVISRVQSWNQNCKKYKGRVVLRGDICKWRLWSLRSFHWATLVCVPNDCGKSNGC